MLSTHFSGEKCIDSLDLKEVPKFLDDLVILSSMLERQEECFMCLPSKLGTVGVLGFTDSKRSYILYTEAGLYGLGAVLY